jgi:hypothetical protein
MGQSKARRVIAISVAAMAVMMAELPSGRADPDLDLTITNIEVTQAIQTPSNTIRLVARKGTAVRVTLATGSASPVSDVTGTLRVFVNGSQVAPPGGLDPINAPFTAPVSPQRANESDTLNFELPAPTGIVASTDVDFRVHIHPVPGEANGGNNDGSVDDLTFRNRRTPFLFFTRINYTPAGLGLPPLSFVQPGTGDAFVRGVLPVNDGDPNLYRQGLFPTLTYSEDAGSNGILNTPPGALGSDGNDLLDLLESCRQLIVSSGVGATDRVFLYGWIAGNPVEGNGLAQLPGRVAFGNSDPIRGQRSYAHELIHNFGRVHNSDTIGQVDWDVGGRLVGNPAGNNTTTRVKPSTFFDIMNPGHLTDEAYVEASTYNALLDHPALQLLTIKFPLKVAVIRGIFDPTGEQLIRLDPVFRYPWASQPTSQGRVPPEFAVQVVDSAGNVLTRKFAGLVATDPGEGEQMVPGAFSIMVPVAEDQSIRSLRITDASGRVSFKTLKATEPPQISLVTPAPGAVLGSRQVVSWKVSDPDTAQGNLMYEVAYSPDSGRSWVPVAVDLPGRVTNIAFDSSRLQQTDGRGQIRVFVSDGLNTKFATVGGLFH